MNNEKNRIGRHLTKDEILMVLVDETDLGPELQKHLSTCLRCNGEKKNLEQWLHNLSHMAEQMAPSPTRSIRLPKIKDRFHFKSPWGWKSVLGMAAATVLVMILVWPRAKFNIRTKDVMRQELQQDNQLITQVDVLVKDALPMKYREILLEDETQFDQDFMQYIVPPIKDNISSPLSYSKKGVIS